MSNTAFKSAYRRALMDTHRVQHKKVAALSGIHASTLSRHLSGGMEINPAQEIQLDVAIGRAIEQDKVDSQKNSPHR